MSIGMVIFILVLVSVLVTIAAVSFYWYRHWKQKAIDYMNLLSQAQDKLKTNSNTFREKGIEEMELKKEIKNLEKENKELRRNK